MSQIFVRINGIGNAWPVILGQDHPFYDKNQLEDLANASCSIVEASKANPGVDEIEWELMIDAGHGVVQYLLKYNNRIPDALFLTHPHIDHTLGVDWIIQSYYKTHHKKYPVYCTSLCWEKTIQAFPQLKEMVAFKELIPYKNTVIAESGNKLSVIPVPVYHGQSAVGAAMFRFEYNDEKINKRILISGDILCPILRKTDYVLLDKIDLFLTDANNRFPYPKSNHWSILNGLNNINSEILKEYKNNITIAKILYPHINDTSFNYSRCFDDFFNQEERIHELLFSISDFVQRFKPRKSILMHYSGSEDEKYYGTSRLSFSDMSEWLDKSAKENNLESELIMAKVGQCIKP